VWKWLLPLLQTLAAVGALAYATIRVSFQYFYDAFGITPESVGANSTTILAESSLRVVEFGLLFAVVPVSLMLAGLIGLDRHVPSSWLPRLVIRRAVLAVPAVGLFPLFQLLTHGRTYSFVVAFSLIGLWVLAIVTRADDKLTLRELCRGASALVIVALAGFVCCWIVITSLAQDGREAGACARAGMAVRYIDTHRHYPWTKRIPVLRVQAETIDPATAARLGEAPRARLLYLGESAGTAVIWDATSARTLLLRSASEIRLVPRRPGAPVPAGCHAYLS
jgi:hypothetical protein